MFFIKHLERDVDNYSMSKQMPEILNTIQFMFNSLNNVSVLSMFPFLVLSPTDDRKDLYRFLQYKGAFYSRPFSVLPLKLKEFTWITAYRYFVNKRIFAQIEKLTRMEDFEAFVSFKNPYTIRVSLYHKDIAKVINYQIKLFSGSINFKFADFFTYWFKLNKKQRLDIKIRNLQLKSEKLQQIANLPTLEDIKVINRQTKELINNIAKKYKEERKKEKEELTKKKLENIMTEEKKRQQLDIEKMDDKDYNRVVVSTEEIDKRHGG